MEKKQEYAFVIDNKGKKLDPMKYEKAWYKIRHGKAKLVTLYPLTIQLFREIPDEEINKDKKVIGIDDGSKNVGIAIVQECQTKNKVLFKGTIEQRDDVKKKLEIKKGHRRYRRSNKRYRPVRFDNRTHNKECWIAPSIKQKKEAILRVIRQINKWINIDNIMLEDVAIDIRALTDGKRLYRWQYQKSNKLDNNIRKAVILRDKCKCQMCGKENTILEVHHIIPRRDNGANTLSNLITLCSNCHSKVSQDEYKYKDMLLSKINGKENLNLNYAMHTMIGKTYLRKELSKIAELELTTGGDTANKREDWKIEKTHSNDAICITNLKPDTIQIKEWLIKPMRRKSKAKTDNVLGIKHRDLVEYQYRNGEIHKGYVTALYPELKALNFQSPTKHCNKVNAEKCRLIWKYNKIYWLNVA